MHFRSLALAALVGAVNAQTQAPMNLTAAAASANLTTLASLLNSTGLLTTLAGLQNITILAPNDEALAAFTEANASAANDTDLLTAVLQYHVVNGTVTSDQIQETPTFVSTLLTNETFTSLPGGQVVGAVSQNGSAYILSGLNNNSTVVTADVEFAGGVIHVIDSVLTLPEGPITTAATLNYSAFGGALATAGLNTTLANLTQTTIFAPNNSAFQIISDAARNLSTDALAAILTYHVINGTVAYSTDLTNGQEIATAAGEDASVVITIQDDGDVFVNDARVIVPNILLSNGVLHIIDQVLAVSEEGEEDNEVDPTASAGVPAYPTNSAGPSSDVPFTSAAPTPTASGPASGDEEDNAATPSSSGAAQPMKTGAVGAAALFGGAALLLNY